MTRSSTPGESGPSLALCRMTTTILQLGRQRARKLSSNPNQVETMSPPEPKSNQRQTTAALTYVCLCSQSRLRMTDSWPAPEPGWWSRKPVLISRLMYRGACSSGCDCSLRLVSESWRPCMPTSATRGAGFMFANESRLTSGVACAMSSRGAR